MTARRIAMGLFVTMFILTGCAGVEENAPNGTPEAPVSGGQVIWYDTDELGTVPCFVIERGISDNKTEAMSCDWSRRVME